MKYLILTASVLIQACIGGIYAWSEFIDPLVTHGLSTAQTQLIFGAFIMVFTSSMVLAGRLLPRFGPRVIACTGGILFGLGFGIAFASGANFMILLLGISVVAGAGTGFCYVCPVAMCGKWFPENKGFATGIAVAGFGGGAIALSALVKTMLANNLDVLEIFGWIGLIYAILIIVASLPLHFPGESSTLPPPLAIAPLARDRYFWALVIGIFAGTFAGLMYIGNLKELLESQGLSDTIGSLAVSVLAAGNAFGRISWGWATDRLKGKSIPFSLCFLAMALFVSLFCLGTNAGAIILSTLIGIGFGACFIVYAAEAGSRYGTSHIGAVYPLIFLAYGFSGLIGPWIGGMIYDKTTSYTPGLTIGAITVVLGAIISHLLMKSAPEVEEAH